ncbi:hypothetical protein FB45DRAFT_1096120 [Roridomyces roridus]|uniref:Uncharacterized protein n=1 Tax=Roridomyces roridus TaxID=1738132 RepID=A0AAD7BGE7_9AGAR|nr:hypothetical protein FB45DRAFT_1096120 [Roridomyces roridus]
MEDYLSGPENVELGERRGLIQLSTNLGPLKYCVNASSKPYMGAAGVTPVAHDTIIFLAISWRLFQNSHTTTVTRESHLDMKGVVSFFTGSKLPRFSRALLHDGQVYYLVTVACNLLTLIMFYNSDVQVTYRTMFTAGNVMLSNVMASRVWRHTKFGFKARGGTEFSSGTHSAFIAAPGPGRNPRASLSSGRPEHGIEIFHMKSTVLDIDEASVDNCKNETTFTHAGDAVDAAV